MQIGLTVMQIMTTTATLPALTRYQNGTGAIVEASERFCDAGASNQEKTILIIDDNGPIREALTLVLEYEHFKVITATDGCEGLAIALREKPDLIVVDFSLPRLSGAQVLAQLRRQAEFTNVPVLAITAYDEWAAADILDAGADRAMLKPLDPDQLTDCVRELLGQKPEEKAAPTKRQTTPNLLSSGQLQP